MAVVIMIDKSSSTLQCQPFLAKPFTMQLSKRFEARGLTLTKATMWPAATLSESFIMPRPRHSLWTIAFDSLPPACAS